MKISIDKMVAKGMKSPEESALKGYKILGGSKEKKDCVLLYEESKELKLRITFTVVSEGKVIYYTAVQENKQGSAMPKKSEEEKERIIYFCFMANKRLPEGFLEFDANGNRISFKSQIVLDRDDNEIARDLERGVICGRIALYRAAQLVGYLKNTCKTDEEVQDLAKLMY